MGSTYCVKYCGKNEKDPSSESEDNKPTCFTFPPNNNSLPQYNYNNFSKKFNTKIHYLGKYFNVDEFKKIIPKNANNYMIQNVLSIPKNIAVNKFSYQMKPVEFQNGNIYSGNWNEKYKMEGYGQYFIKEANLFVEGIWESGKLIYGRIFFPNENIYEGEIKNSSFMGKGKLIFNNGDIYIGDFNDGERTGKGKYYFKDGTVYEGEFLNGEFKGPGVMKWINGIEFNGNFNGISLNGKGKIINKTTGDSYKGNFDNNYFNEYGIYTYGNLGSYEGQFDYGLKHGRGIYKNKDGLCYEGEWKNDLPNGSGKLKNNDFIVKGIWENGKNIEITDFIKGSVYNFDKNNLNLEIPFFSLFPQSLNNLSRQDFSYENKFEVENTNSFS